jgi:hypothetical protein
VRSQLYVALDQNYLSDAVVGRLLEQAAEVGCMIGGLMIYLRKSGIKGTKYKKPGLT